MIKYVTIYYKTRAGRRAEKSKSFRDFDYAYDYAESVALAFDLDIVNTCREAKDLFDDMGHAIVAVDVDPARTYIGEGYMIAIENDATRYGAEYSEEV